MTDLVIGLARRVGLVLTGAWRRARVDTDEQLARAVGRTAGYVDEAGERVGLISAWTAAQVSRWSYTAARGVSERADRVAERIAARAQRHGYELGDRVVTLGENLDRVRTERRSRANGAAHRGYSAGRFGRSGRAMRQ